jgi:endo-1,4-beta-xylanase
VKRRNLIAGATAALVLGQLAGCARVDRTQTGSVTAPDRPPAGPAQPATSPSVRGLRSAASNRGLYFGAAIQSAALGDSRFRSNVVRDCSIITPEWAMKWDSLAPGRTYNFGEMDQLASFAARNGLAMRGHTLLWHKSLPRWAAAALASSRDWALIEDHFSKVIGRYGNQVREWDVVNEPIEPEHGGNGLRQNQFYKAFGESYIQRALETARARAPRARMVINEYGLEYNSSYEGQRRLTLLRLLERLRSRGVPVDTVGLQAHLDLRKGKVYADGIYGLMRDIGNMGLKVAITELDVAEANTGLSIERRDSLVADETRRYLDIVLQFNNVLGVSTWGLSDSHSWLRTQRSAANRGLPYDRDWRAKPMHGAILTAFA